MALQRPVVNDEAGHLFPPDIAAKRRSFWNLKLDMKHWRVPLRAMWRGGRGERGFEEANVEVSGMCCKPRGDACFVNLTSCA